MSAPQISGVVGLLRSINPLVLPSKPTLLFGDVPGIRTVLAQTTVQAQTNQAWTPTFGYGRPDAAAAARKMLGKVAGRVVKNRVTPLFRMYSAGATDYADTTSPQIAIALNIYQAASYAPQGAVIPGYPGFPYEPGTTALPTPRAAVYVLTTEYTPWPNYPPLLPLYSVSRSRNLPLGCTTGATGCNSHHRDFTLMTTTADIQQAHTDGFDLRTVQGYIYQQCSPEPQCIPPAAQKFYRECNASIDDCATFLESERATFEANGYTTAYPASSSKLLGYAYPSTDSDGDGLVDGFEYVIGTNPFLADSNGDGTPDGVEFPMAGVPVSDPCLGVGAGNCPASGTLPDLTITKTHSGSFTPGQIGATYTLTVTNVGSSPTTAPVTVNDILPSGSPAPLTVTGIQGNTWACTGGATPVCTNSNSLGSGLSYPVITATVNLAASPPANIINTATVSGGGEINLANNTATDSTTIVLPPDVTITKVHNGYLSQGQIGATYTLTVKNVGGGPTTGSVTVTDILPSSLTATAMSGTNWTCTTGTTSSCTNSTQLAGGATYSPITLTVNVASSAASISNTATVSGGGDTTSANNSANDVTSAQVVDNAALATVLANPQTFTGAWPGFSFGMAGDIPMVMRLNGSLIPVLYRPSTQFWYLNLAGFANGNVGNTRMVQFGLAGDSPQIVNLRGVDHVAVYRPSVGQVLLDTDNQTYSGGNVQTLGAWQPLIPATVSQIVSTPNSFNGVWYNFSFGLPGDVPLLIQLTAGGPKLPVVYRPSVASWYINLGGYANYNANQLQVVAFGLPTDVPEVVYWNGGDHLAVYRPSTGQTLVDTNNQSYNGSNFVIIP